MMLSRKANGHLLSILQHILTEVAGGLRLLVGLRVVTVVVDDSVAQDIECLL
jgi:hypothetical protein